VADIALMAAALIHSMQLAIVEEEMAANEGGLLSNVQRAKSCGVNDGIEVFRSQLQKELGLSIGPPPGLVECLRHDELAKRSPSKQFSALLPGKRG
jgi:hypothetical protein